VLGLPRLPEVSLRAMAAAPLQPVLDALPDFAPGPSEAQQLAAEGQALAKTAAVTAAKLAPFAMRAAAALPPNAPAGAPAAGGLPFPPLPPQPAPLPGSNAAAAATTAAAQTPLAAEAANAHISAASVEAAEQALAATQASTFGIDRNNEALHVIDTPVERAPAPAPASAAATAADANTLVIHVPRPPEVLAVKPPGGLPQPAGLPAQPNQAQARRLLASAAAPAGAPSAAMAPSTVRTLSHLVLRQ
jgi:hypothetical protein